MQSSWGFSCVSRASSIDEGQQHKGANQVLSKNLSTGRLEAEQRIKKSHKRSDSIWLFDVVFCLLGQQNRLNLEFVPTSNLHLADC